MRGEETTAESIKRRMTDLEWNKVYEMAKDKNLYQNLITSLFPTIYGNDEIKRGVCVCQSGCVAAGGNGEGGKIMRKCVREQKVGERVRKCGIVGGTENG